MFRVCPAGGSSPGRLSSVDIIAGSFEYALEGAMEAEGKAGRKPGDAMNEWKADAANAPLTEHGKGMNGEEEHPPNARQRNATRHDF